MGPTPCGGRQRIENWAKSEGRGWYILYCTRYYGGCRGDCRSVCLLSTLYRAPGESSYASFMRQPSKGSTPVRSRRKPYTLRTTYHPRVLCVLYVCSCLYTNKHTLHEYKRISRQSCHTKTLTRSWPLSRSYRPYGRAQETAFLCPSDSSLNFQNSREESLFLSYELILVSIKTVHLAAYFKSLAGKI